MAELSEPDLTFDIVESGCHGNYEVVPVRERSKEKIKLPAKTVSTCTQEQPSNK